MPDPLSHRDRSIISSAISLCTSQALKRAESAFRQRFMTLAELDFAARAIRSVQEAACAPGFFDALLASLPEQVPYQTHEAAAKVAVERIVCDLNARKGLGIATLAEDTQALIMQKWISVVSRAFDAAYAGQPAETAPKSADEEPVSLPTIVVHLGDWAELIAVASDFTFFGKPANALATDIRDLGMPELPGPGLWAWADAGSVVVDARKLFEVINWRGQWRRLTPAELSAFAGGTQS